MALNVEVIRKLMFNGIILKTFNTNVLNTSKNIDKNLPNQRYIQTYNTESAGFL